MIKHDWMRWIGLVMMLAIFGCSPDVSNAPLDPIKAGRSSSDNDILYCPQGMCQGAEHISPVFEKEPQELFKLWQQLIQSEPRTDIVAVDAEKLLIHAHQRSRVLRFVDTILIRIEPVPNGASFVALSRSELGKSDFGVNAERMADWVLKMTTFVGS